MGAARQRGTRVGLAFCKASTGFSRHDLSSTSGHTGDLHEARLALLVPEAI